MSEKKYIFVHGLSGWGSYDEVYKRMPYWGMRGGDLIAFLRGRGFDCYAASVSPAGSAWDRACELYAQLSGSITDYGQAHARRFGHERFGKNFRGRPLVPEMSGEQKFVLLGHSFGGATIRLFSHLMQHGDEQEREEYDWQKNGVPQENSGAQEDHGAQDISPLFMGAEKGRIHSLVTLAAPHNGTTAYDLFEDPSFDPDSVKAPFWSEGAARMMSGGTAARMDGRDPRDYAGYDMHIDRADELNRMLRTDPDIYYFSIPCSATVSDEYGNHVPAAGKMEPLFVRRSYQIGAYSGKSAGGIALGDEWKENDGLVNIISAMAPSHAPKKKFSSRKIEPGIWQVLPTYHEDHMALQGGLLHKHDVRGFYVKLLSIIDSL